MFVQIKGFFLYWLNCSGKRCSVVTMFLGNMIVLILNSPNILNSTVYMSLFFVNGRRDVLIWACLDIHLILFHWFQGRGFCNVLNYFNVALYLNKPESRFPKKTYAFGAKLFKSGTLAPWILRTTPFFKLKSLFCYCQPLMKHIPLHLCN